jgi:hypothetical protein
MESPELLEIISAGTPFSRNFAAISMVFSRNPLYTKTRRFCRRADKI